MKLIKTLIILIVTLFPGFSNDSTSIVTYRLRSDQLDSLKLNDGKETFFWREWADRSYYMTKRKCFNPQSGIDDGEVIISVKSAATPDTLYFHVHLQYVNEAPGILENDEHVDFFSITAEEECLGIAAQQDNPCFTRLFIKLSEHNRLVKQCINAARLPIYGGEWKTTVICRLHDGELIQVDSHNKIIETKMAWTYNLPADTSVAPSWNPRSFDIRYHTSENDTIGDSTALFFAPGDTGVHAPRIYRGDLMVDPLFNAHRFFITSPRPGRRLTAGDNITIRWGYTRNDGLLKLEYSPNGKNDWLTIINSTANDGAYPWQIPLVQSDQCYLRLVFDDTITAETGPFSITGDILELIHLADTVQQPVFRWTEVGSDLSYRLIVDTSSLFDMPIIDTLIKGTRFSPISDLPDHQIYWKVASELDYQFFSATDSFYHVKSENAVRFSAVGHFNNRIHYLPNREIRFQLKYADHITISLSDLRGKTIAVVYSDYLTPGEYHFSLKNSSLPGSGFYLLRYSGRTVFQTVPIILSN